MSNESRKLGTLMTCQMAMERCRHYIAHIHAILYLSESEKDLLDEYTKENLHDLLGVIDRELAVSLKSLQDTARDFYDRAA